jgi:hypothetical protein
MRGTTGERVSTSRAGSEASHQPRQCQSHRTFASLSERLSTTDPLAPSSLVHFFPLGDRHRGRVYVLLPDGTCSETSAVEGETVYELEAELDPNELARVKLVRNR